MKDCRVAVLMFALTVGAGGCGDDQKKSVAPSPETKAYECAGHSDCRVSCMPRGGCCAEPCACTNVYHVDEHEAVRVDNAALCKNNHEACEDMDCGEPSEETYAVCVQKKCVGIMAPSGVNMKDGFFVTDQTPSPATCETAADCIGDTVADATGCCQEHTLVRPHARKYRDWVTGWRQKRCGHVKCPLPPSPYKPEDCLFEMKCVAGTCANSCS